MLYHRSATGNNPINIRDIENTTTVNDNDIGNSKIPNENFFVSSSSFSSEESSCSSSSSSTQTLSSRSSSLASFPHTESYQSLISTRMDTTIVNVSSSSSSLIPTYCAPTTAAVTVSSLQDSVKLIPSNILSSSSPPYTTTTVNNINTNTVPVSNTTTLTYPPSSSNNSTVSPSSSLLSNNYNENEEKNKFNTVVPLFASSYYTPTTTTSSLTTLNFTDYTLFSLSRVPDLVYLLYLYGVGIIFIRCWVSPLIHLFVRIDADKNLILLPNLIGHICLITGFGINTLIPLVYRTFVNLYQHYNHRIPQKVMNNVILYLYNPFDQLYHRFLPTVTNVIHRINQLDFIRKYCNPIGYRIHILQKYTFTYLHIGVILWLCLSLGWIGRLSFFRTFRPIWRLIPSRDMPEAFLYLSSSSATSTLIDSGALPPRTTTNPWLMSTSSSSSSSSSLTWKPRIAITTIAGGYKPETAAKVLHNFRNYAALHGYTFIEGLEYYSHTGSSDWRTWEPVLDTTHTLFIQVRKTKIAWCKFPLLWNLSHSFDFIMWLDMDAVITNPSISLEEIMGLMDNDKPLPIQYHYPNGTVIQSNDNNNKESMDSTVKITYPLQKELWIGEDVNHRPWSKVPLAPLGTVHAGVFILRGSVWTQQLLATLLRERVPEHLLAEQYAIDTAIFYPRDKDTEALQAQDRVLLLPYYAFDSTPNSYLWSERWLHGDFIAHNMGDLHKEPRLQAYLAWMSGEISHLPLWTYIY